MKNRKEISVFVRRAFLRLLPVQIAGILVGTINAFVDNVFTGQFLGTEAIIAHSANLLLSLSYLSFRRCLMVFFSSVSYLEFSYF